MDEGCVFCGIVAGTVAADVVLDDDVAVAFLDRSPVFKGHVLVVPRLHVVTLTDLETYSIGPFFERVQRIARRSGRARCARNVRRQQQRCEPERGSPARARRPATQAGRSSRLSWPREKDDAGEAARYAERDPAPPCATRDHTHRPTSCGDRGVRWSETPVSLVAFATMRVLAIRW